jgi:hypothetical protein
MHRAVPAVNIGVYLGVAITIIILTFAANLGAARRAMRASALTAIT